MTDAHFQIRSATPSDSANIARVNVEAWQSAYAGILPTDYLVNMLTLEPGTHYLVSVDAALSNQQTGEVAPYVIHSGDQVPDQELRLLPLPGGLSTRSIYGEDGVIRQSERLERWILWPMRI